jgi:hypothetical protein
MTANVSGNGSPARAATRRNSTFPLLIVAAILIVVPFLFWYGTWFGRELKDEEIEKYLSDEKNPRHMQHALSQIAARIAGEEQDPKRQSARRWYPRVIALAASPLPEIRIMAAWVMGQDNRSAEFQAELARLLDDTEPLVRRNAALGLVRFGDARGRAEIRAMLRPLAVAAPASGRITAALTQGTSVRAGELLGKVETGEGQALEVRAPVPGVISEARVRQGTPVASGEKLFAISPDEASAWEALRALYLIGQRDDLPDVKRYAEGTSGMSQKVQQQARLTAAAIEQRAAQNPAALNGP